MKLPDQFTPEFAAEVKTKLAEAERAAAIRERGLVTEFYLVRATRHCLFNSFVTDLSRQEPVRYPRIIARVTVLEQHPGNTKEPRDLFERLTPEEAETAISFEQAVRACEVEEKDRTAQIRGEEIARRCARVAAERDEKIAAANLELADLAAKADLQTSARERVQEEKQRFCAERGWSNAAFQRALEVRDLADGARVQEVESREGVGPEESRSFDQRVYLAKQRGELAEEEIQTLILISESHGNLDFDQAIRMLKARREARQLA
jgi:hypothetical protein